MNPDSPSPIERPPPRIPDYEVLRRIGQGAYGEVWLARNVTGIYHAVKVVYRSRFPDPEPYEREFQGMQRFEPLSREHPGLMDVLHVGRDDAAGFFYYLVELADDQERGQQIDPERYAPRTLSSELQRRGRLPVAECLRMGVALAAALQDLHEQGLVHRDLKPANVIFVKGVPKLADIGLVADAGETPSRLGTLAYVAPEGSGRAPADVFALGLVLHEMVTGGQYPSLPEGLAKAPDFRDAMELRQIALRACEPSLERRFLTAREVESALVRLANKPARRAERALRQALAALAVVVVGGALAGVWALRNWALEQSRRGELKDIHLSRLQVRRTGWFSNDWSRLQRVADGRDEPEVLEQATALLRGLDAHAIRAYEGRAARSAAFGPDGRVLLGGAGAAGPALLLETNGAITELPARGEGCVGWSLDGEPLQLVSDANGLVLRELRSGSVRQHFALGQAEGAVTERVSALVLPPAPAWPERSHTHAHSAGGGENPPDVDSRFEPADRPSGGAPASSPAWGVRGANAAENGGAPVCGLAAVAAGVSGQVLVWKASDGARLGSIRAEATCLAFSPDGSLLAIGGSNGATRVCGVPLLQEVAVLPPALRANPITALAFGRDPIVPYGGTGRTNAWLLAVGDQGAGLVIWDLARRVPRTFCRGSTWNVQGLAFSPDGLTLASAGRNHPLLWDVATGMLLLQLDRGSSGDTPALAFDGTGRRLLQGSVPGAAGPAVVLYELAPDRGIRTLRGLPSPTRKVWFSPDSQQLAALSDDWHLAIWELESGRPVAIFETPVGELADNAGGAFDARGGRFAFVTGAEACLYDLAAGEVTRRWRVARGLSDQLQFDERQRLLLLRVERSGGAGERVWRLYELTAASPPVLLRESPRRSAWPIAVALAGDGSGGWCGTGVRWASAASFAPTRPPRAGKSGRPSRRSRAGEWGSRWIRRGGGSSTSRMKPGVPAWCASRTSRKSRCGTRAATPSVPPGGTSPARAGFGWAVAAAKRESPFPPTGRRWGTWRRSAPMVAGWRGERRAAGCWLPSSLKCGGGWPRCAAGGPPWRRDRRADAARPMPQNAAPAVGAQRRSASSASSGTVRAAPRLAAWARARSSARKWLNEATKSARNRPVSGPTAARRSPSSRCARKPCTASWAA